MKLARMAKTLAAATALASVSLSTPSAARSDPSYIMANLDGEGEREFIFYRTISENKNRKRGSPTDNNVWNIADAYTVLPWHGQNCRKETYSGGVTTHLGYLRGIQWYGEKAAVMKTVLRANGHEEVLMIYPDGARGIALSYNNQKLEASKMHIISETGSEISFSLFSSR